MIRIILDTNVFVSGIFWGGVPLQILQAWEDKKLKFVFSQEILEEYIQVTHRLAKKYQSRLDITLTLEVVMTYGELASPVLLDKPISCDPDDDKFIACALGAECFLIVSGDSDLLDVSGHAGIKVLKPGEFVKNHL